MSSTTQYHHVEAEFPTPIGTVAASRDIRTRKDSVTGEKEMAIVGKRTSNRSPSTEPGLLATERQGWLTVLGPVPPPPPPPPPLLRVYIAVVPGSGWGFNYAGTPMMTRQSTVGPWPQLRGGVEAKRRWIILVMPAGNAVPTRAMLESAEYFDCIHDRMLGDNPNSRALLVAQMEALQEIGLTNLTNNEIQNHIHDLEPYWNGYHDILWNTQSFTLCLATLVLTDASFNSNGRLLGELFLASMHKASDAFQSGMLGRHVGCMVGMGVTGIATFGFGAFAFWAGAGASMASGIMAEESAQKAFAKLRADFEKFRRIL